MIKKIAIYSLGRLGRSVFAIAAKRRDMDVVAIVTDLSPRNVVDKMLNDPVYSPTDPDMKAAEDHVVFYGQRVEIIPKKKLANWGDLEIDTVVDCEAVEATQKMVDDYLADGAKQVVFSAVSKDLPQVVYGVNEEDLTKGYVAISCGGAASSAVSPLSDYLNSEYGIENMIVTTIHGDMAADYQRCKCEGKCVCRKTNVIKPPTLTASMSEMTVLLKRAVKQDQIKDSIKEMAKNNYYQGIVAVDRDGVVPDEVIGESLSALVDIERTEVSGRMASIKLWYDREWGYANRIVEITADFAKKGEKNV